MSTPSDIAKKYNPYRLPDNVKPVHYDLTIKTDLENLTFDGVATIDLKVAKDTTEIVFNAGEELALHDVTVRSTALKTEQVQSAKIVDKSNERAIVELSNALPAESSAQLKVSFTSKLTGSMLGYYYSTYKSEGKEIPYALTQFEPTFARRAFPCWDEPAIKATFDVTLLSRSNTVNLSNMPAISETPYAHKPNTATGGVVDTLSSLFHNLKVEVGLKTENVVHNNVQGEWKVTKFDTTPIMSTYLVAFANGPFEHIESSYTSPLSGKVRPLRVYATPDIIHQTQWGLDVKARVLPEYEKVFNIEFPLPKLDTLVAHDFDAGAMENWGLITGRTSAYLLDPKNADIRAKKRIASVQTHEVAHQWFGNIVTMAWWDNLWLNEGFATLMGEMIILNKLVLIQPDWNLYPEFGIEHLADALSLDSRRTSHPIEVPIEDANLINQIFDSLSYSKAGSVLRMLSAYAGEEAFLKGVSIYLKKHLYGNSVTTDLWDGIAEATGLDIRSLMNNWILKIGYPVLTVTETPEGITVRQDRFLSDGSPTLEENATIWQVPLAVLSADASGKASLNRTALLTERETSLKLDTSKPFKLNGGNVGVYRVLYSSERVDKIAQEAGKESSIFSLDDRMGLLSDGLALAQASLAKTSALLTVVDRLRNEKEQLVWKAVIDALGEVNSLFWLDGTIKENLRELRRSLFAPLVPTVGFTYPSDESVDAAELRTLVITQAALTGDPNVIKELQGRFETYMTSGSLADIPPDLIRITFRTAVKHGGRREWEKMKSIYLDPPTPTLQLAAIAAMCHTQDAKLIEETLKFTESVRTQDVVYFWSALRMNHGARSELAEYTMSNWDGIYKRFEKGFSQLSRIVAFAFDKLSASGDADKIEAFFKGKDTSAFSMSLAQTLELIKVNAKWRTNSLEDVEQWLVQWKKGSKL
ncbi:leucyl aminopeptidase [Sistotremastrum suecicum HHB10207 ss-3]|uniref:Aminopeptidase n=1 Tax=Sistotremastrum suecicum HHB10207 ss-3 TaxID=1314776 RepID=A0A166IVS5_9AGAM|nr:leucyl aminopeptidase [Sistotremastrum suecicum HHB10207 ss-3]